MSLRLCLQNAKATSCKWVISISLSVSSTQFPCWPPPHKCLTRQFVLTFWKQGHKTEDPDAKQEWVLTDRAFLGLPFTLPRRRTTKHHHSVWLQRCYSRGKWTYRCWTHILPLEFSLYPRPDPRILSMNQPLPQPWPPSCRTWRENDLLSGDQCFYYVMSLSILPFPRCPRNNKTPYCLSVANGAQSAA